jgi:hypothetical protein
MARAVGAVIAIRGMGIGVAVPEAPLAATPETSGEPAQAAAQLDVSKLMLITGLPPPLQARRASRGGMPDRSVLAKRAYVGGEKPGKTFLTCDFGVARAASASGCRAGLGPGGYRQDAGRAPPAHRRDRRAARPVAVNRRSPE